MGCGCNKKKKVTPQAQMARAMEVTAQMVNENEEKVPKNYVNLEYHGVGAEVTFPANGRRYRVGGNKKTVFVHPDDVKLFLGMAERGKRLFTVYTDPVVETVAAAESTEKLTEESTDVLVQNVDESDIDKADVDEVNAVDEEADDNGPIKDDFTLLKGIGKVTQAKLYDQEVFTYRDLYNKGLDFISDLLGNQIMAKNMYNDLEERLTVNRQ